MYSTRPGTDRSLLGKEKKAVFVSSGLSDRLHFHRTKEDVVSYHSSPCNSALEGEAIRITLTSYPLTYFGHCFFLKLIHDHEGVVPIAERTLVVGSRLSRGVALDSPRRAM